MKTFAIYFSSKSNQSFEIVTQIFSETFLYFEKFQAPCHFARDMTTKLY